MPKNMMIYATMLYQQLTLHIDKTGKHE